MSDGKIKITLDDVRSSSVDARIKQQKFYNKAQTHQQQIAALTNDTPRTTTARGRARQAF